MRLCRTAFCLFVYSFVPVQGQSQSCSAPCSEWCGNEGLTLPGSNGRIVNVAFGKAASVSSPYIDGQGTSAPACIAVNGRTRTTYRTINESNTNCVHTGRDDYNASWSVDLGRDYTVTNMTIYRRRGYQRRMSGIHVEVDNQTCHTFPLLADNPTALDNLPEKIDVTCTPPLTGRVVRLQKRGERSFYVYTTHMINVCEVQIWGCQDGLYGAECVEQCGQCAGSDTCSAVSGHCPNGCQPGWQGDNCKQNLPCTKRPTPANSQVCTGKMYGAQCDKPCSAQCGGDGSCHRNNGTCQAGCVSGYLLGSGFCDEKCQSGAFGPGCAKKCGNCAESRCNHRNGTCEVGCIGGYVGDMCSETSESSPNLAGPVAGGVFGGLCVVALSILLVGLLIRRSRKRSPSETASPPQASADQNFEPGAPVELSGQAVPPKETGSAGVAEAEESHIYDGLQTPDDSDRAPYSTPVFKGKQDKGILFHTYQNSALHTSDSGNDYCNL